MQPRIDTTQLRQIAIAPLIQQDLGAAQRQAGHHLYWLCPFHPDHTPSLDVDTEKNKAFCNPCALALDPVGWVMRYRHLNFVEAARALGAASVEPQPVAVSPAPEKKALAIEPIPAWRAAAADVVAYGVAKLWEDSEHSRRVVAYLNRRGLTNETLRRWEVGYNPAGHMFQEIWINPGILLPCRMDGQLWYVTIRLLPHHVVKCSKCGQQVALTPANKCPSCDAKLKYRSVPGGVPALWGADTCRERRVVFGCEGEFDAMLTWQEARALGGVFTRTNGAGKQWRDDWSLYLMDAEAVLLLFDNDAAGEAGKLKIAALSDRMIACSVPNGCKDVTDYAAHGHRLYTWLTAMHYLAIMEHVADVAQQVAYLRERLAVQPPASLAADYKSDLYLLGEQP